MDIWLTSEIAIRLYYHYDISYIFHDESRFHGFGALVLLRETMVCPWFLRAKNHLYLQEGPFIRHAFSFSAALVLLTDYSQEAFINKDIYVCFIRMIHHIKECIERSQIHFNWDTVHL